MLELDKQISKLVALRDRLRALAELRDAIPEEVASSIITMTTHEVSATTMAIDSVKTTSIARE